MARARLMRLVTKKPTVTAGLMWPPLTWPMIQTAVATLSPKHRAICTNFPSSSQVTTDPHPIMVRMRVPKSSAPTARQNRRERMSSRLVAILALQSLRAHPGCPDPLSKYLVSLFISRGGTHLSLSVKTEGAAFGSLTADYLSFMSIVKIRHSRPVLQVVTFITGKSG